MKLCFVWVFFIVWIEWRVHDCAVKKQNNNGEYYFWVSLAIVLLSHKFCYCVVHVAKEASVVVVARANKDKTHQSVCCLAWFASLARCSPCCFSCVGLNRFSMLTIGKWQSRHWRRGACVFPSRSVVVVASDSDPDRAWPEPFLFCTFVECVCGGALSLWARPLSVLLTSLRHFYSRACLVAERRAIVLLRLFVCCCCLFWLRSFAHFALARFSSLLTPNADNSNFTLTTRAHV